MKTSDRLHRSSFLKNVAILGGGTVLAKMVLIVASPILTRLYTPAEFGLFAVFMALVSSLSPAVCGRYEVAMVLPKSQKDGLHLLGICFRIAIVVSLVTLSVAIVFRNPLLTLLDAHQLGKWIYFVPFALLLTGLLRAMKYFSNRHRDYKSIARGMMIDSVCVVAISISLGMLGVGFGGLLAGTLVGLVSATSYLVCRYWTELPANLMSWGTAKVECMRRYRDYPLYNASTGLLNGVAAAMPIFFLAHYFPQSIVGCFALVLRVASTPLSFISTSVSQVNLKRVVDLVNGKNDVRPYLLRVTMGLIAIVLVPTIILTIFSPTIFSFVFGEEWRKAGIYMQILMPALAVRCVASTLSTTLGATNNNRLDAMWKVTAFVVTIIVFAVFAPQRDAITLFKAVLVKDVSLYLFYYALIWMAATTPRNQILQST